MRSDFITSFRKHLNSDNRVNNRSKRQHLAKRFSAVCKDCKRCSCYFSCRLLLPTSGFRSIKLLNSRGRTSSTKESQQAWNLEWKGLNEIVGCIFAVFVRPRHLFVAILFKIVNQESTRDKRNRLNAQVCHFDLWLILSLKTIDQLMEEGKKIEICGTIRLSG